MWDEILKWYAENSGILFRAVIIVLIGFPFLKIAAFLFRKGIGKYFSDQQVMLFTKTLTYLGAMIIIVMVLRELGFKLTTLLGAAGIAGVAIGLAAQTSLANVISGIFLIWEKPFEVGDLLQVDSHKGLVHSIDLLSVQLCTFDNQLIRIPNETLIKTSFTNITRFPIRRMDLKIGVAYKENVEKVMKVLREVADRNPYCLDEPEPVIIFRGFGDSALEFLFAPWFAKEDFIALRNSILKEVKERFDKEGIEIPFPHRTLYTGAVTDPFPITLVEPESELESEKAKGKS